MENVTKPQYVRSLGSVSELMETADQTVRPFPGIPSIEERKLRLALILEELKELSEAYGLAHTFGEMCALLYANSPATDTHIVDKIEVLDAHTDLRVVCDGGILQDGMGHVFSEAFKRVHASNMSKFPQEEQVAKDTVGKYAADGIKAYYVQRNGRFVIKRSDNNKFLKATTYHKPDLTDLVS